MTHRRSSGKTAIGGQRLYRRHPPGSAITVEGDGRISGRASSAGALTAYGRRETYQGDLRVNTLADASLKATQAISDYIRRSQPLTLTRQPRLVDPFPLVDYNLGDTVNVSEPPFMDKLGRRLVGLTWAVDADAEEVTEHYGAVSYVGEAALQQGVYQLLSKFEPIRDVDPDGGITLGGNTIPWLVAASDSPDPWKNAAAYLCAGSNDEETINAALTAVAGDVMLAPGTFYIDSKASGVASINLGLGQSTGARLVGAGGTFGTYITQDTSGRTSPGPLIAVPQFCKLENVYVETSDCDGIALQSGEGSVQNCTVFVIGSSGSCISGLSGTSGDWDISNNYLSSSSTDPIVALTGNQYNVSNNLFYGDGSQIGLQLDSVSDSVIAGNRFYSCTQGVSAVGANSAFRVSITGNDFESPETGVLLDGAATVSIVGNIITDALQHGISLDDTDDCVVNANLIVEPGQNTANTYDGILLLGDSDRNMVHGNKVIPGSSTSTRYGVNISVSTCDTNVVADNMLIPSGTFGTGSFNDAGTGTVTSRDGNGQFT